jgi:hypothetical protein
MSVNPIVVKVGRFGRWCGLRLDWLLETAAARRE